MTPQDLFTAVIDGCQPRSLLAAGHHARAAAEQWRQDHLEAEVDLLDIRTTELAG